MIDAQKAFSNFDSRRLFEWQEKEYIKKIINKWYLFADISITEELAYRVSNCIYSPSYISLESALSHYHFIPEAVYSVQAVSTRKTITYITPTGSYNYRSIKPALYFGYSILQFDGLPLLMAEPEKAMLDYLYLSTLQSYEDLAALRLNAEVLQTNFLWEKLLRYARVFNSAVLDKRIKLLEKLIQHADIK